jgi:putative peptidoglycan lipid II flippase
MNRAILNMTAVNIIGILASIVYSIVVVNLFGTSREIEIYFATNVIIFVVMKLSQGGEISEILLPVYHKYKENESKEVAQRIISIVLNWYVVFLVFLSIITFYSASFLVRFIVPGFTESDHQLGIEMLQAISPVLVIIFFNGQVQSLLNAEKKFGWPEMVDVVSRVLMLITVSVGVTYFDIWIMIIVLWVGALFKFISYIFLYYRTGNRFYFQFNIHGFSIFPIIKKLLHTLPYVGSTQIWAVALNAGLSTLPQGYLAVFNYSQTLVMKISGVFLRPVSTVFFTSFSEGVAKKSIMNNELIAQGLKNIQLILFPVLLVFIVAGKQGLMFLWSSENFSIESINMSYGLIIILLIKLHLDGLYTIARKVVVTFDYVAKVYTFTTLSQLLTAVYAWYAIKFLGINGAVSSLIVNGFLLTIVPFIILAIYKKKYLFFYNLLDVFKWLIVCGLTYFIIIFIKQNFNIFFLNFESIRLNYLFDTLVTSVLASIFIFTIAALLNICSVKTIIKKITTKIMNRLMRV